MIYLLLQLIVHYRLMAARYNEFMGLVKCVDDVSHPCICDLKGWLFQEGGVLACQSLSFKLVIRLRSFSP